MPTSTVPTTLHVTSEVAKLRQVLVHTPGTEMALVSPRNRLDLLLDDILFEERAREEHLKMCELFDKIVGQDDAVLQVSDLLREAFELDDARAAFVAGLAEAQPERNFQAVEDELLKLSPDELHTFALTGQSPLAVLALPVPNLMFTRDLCAVVGNHVLLSHAATSARARESVLIRILFLHHPRFADVRDRVIQLPKGVTFEGGDLLVASEDTVLIGHSERTSFSGVMAVANALFQRTSIEHVLMVDLPKQRSCMHLDTVFTFADEETCVYYPPYFTDGESNVLHLQPTEEPGRFLTQMHSGLRGPMQDLLGRSFEFVPCGGDDPLVQEREQWTDGANLFALAPGLVVGYERNQYTFQRLRRHGYRVVTTDGLLSYYEESDYTPGEKIAIKLEGNELSRGRGGPRCMTMPLARD